MEKRQVLKQQALDAALARVRASGARMTLDLQDGRLVIFSDQHRGARNGADDFRNNERAYNAALAYYDALGSTLIVLGDVEELWEERPRDVIAAYRQSLALEAAFHRQGRYWRIWGNHDDEWQYPARVRQLLGPVYGAAPLPVSEGLVVAVTAGGGPPLGELFLIHGHQGDALSDRWAWFSRWAVRHLWRPFQRLTNFSLNTPATQWNLRHRLNIALYDWAAAQEGLVVIAGHAHEPVFKSQSHEAQIKARLEDLEQRLVDHPTPELTQTYAALKAELAWVRAQHRTTSPDEDGIDLDVPCYFNTGCCSYRDGDVTGLEIAGGKIRLVRWPNEAGDPLPHTLAEADLREVLAAC